MNRSKQDADDFLEGVEHALATRQTPDDLRLLATLKESKFWPPLRVVLFRMQAQGVDALVDSAPGDPKIAKAQGKVSAARELVHFLEKECPRAYEDLRKRQEAQREESPGEQRRARALRGRRGP